MVLGDPVDSSALRVAARMLEVAGNSGATLDTLFLYHKGAYAALNRCADPPLMAHLQRLCAENGLVCVVCRTALARFGFGRDPLSAPFRLGGLVDWLSACERSDRVLRLGSTHA